MKLRRPLYARPEIIRGQHCIRDALLAPTGRNKQQQVAAELWLWAGLPHSGEAPGSVMADIHGHFTEAPGWALASDLWWGERIEIAWHAGVGQSAQPAGIGRPYDAQ